MTSNCKECGKTLMPQKFCSNNCYHKHFSKNKLWPWNNSEVQRKNSLKNKKKKTGFWNREFQSKMGLNSLTSNRINRPYKFMNVLFDSNSEKEFAMNIYYQFKIKLIERVNTHVIIGNKEFDFFIRNTFIEYHPWDRNGVTIKMYRNKRRKILNKFRYVSSKLIIIK